MRVDFASPQSVMAALEQKDAEIDRLTAAIARIDAMNDNPSRYQPDINAVCDTILRPHLVVGQATNKEG